MGSLSPSVLLYIVLCLFAFISGTVYWIRGKFQAGAVLSLIFSLLAPLMTVLVGVQREENTGVYKYIIAEMRTGNTWARLVVIIHIYLIAWLVFLTVYLMIKLFKMPEVRERVRKLFAKKETNKIKEEKIKDKASKSSGES
ncbi:hypothetical protein [Oceanobacillus sp. FSL H7-0719]|uniref:hypothetical protein n=1 Tax=Oceanobacillus sp. FSL H7-0719 TaxID=2954507 RepID=UPI003249C798